MDQKTLAAELDLEIGEPPKTTTPAVAPIAPEPAKTAAADPQKPVFDSAPAPEPAKPATNGHVTSLDEIAGMMAAPVNVDFLWGDKPCRIEARYLTPRETEMLALQLTETMPPVIRGKIEAEDRTDYNNPAYVKIHAETVRRMRAQAVFWACPSIRDMMARGDDKRKIPANPAAVAAMYAPAHRAAIAEFVNGFLVDEVLNLIYETSRRPPCGSVPERTNFT